MINFSIVDFEKPSVHKLKELEFNHINQLTDILDEVRKNDRYEIPNSSERMKKKFNNLINFFQVYYSLKSDNYKMTLAIPLFEDALNHHSHFSNSNSYKALYEQIFLK
ncbi:MAG: hypothetical protein KKF89_03710 [Nanoarchaeota archaeon]|nr:hypothetical protein [Nanoarchaeota archaeon]MBU1854802.1 hypothetical protein [Nanoarchaeota archaeon]